MNWNRFFANAFFFVCGVALARGQWVNAVASAAFGLLFAYHAARWPQ